jgi:TPR repeat protein
MYNLGVLLANQMRAWSNSGGSHWEKAADAETTSAWYEKAADAETTSAMYNLGLLVTNQWDPPQGGPGPHLVRKRPQ